MYIEQTSEASLKKVKSTLSKRRQNKREIFEEVEKQTHSRVREKKTECKDGNTSDANRTDQSKVPKKERENSSTWEKGTKQKGGKKSVREKNYGKTNKKMCICI